MCGIAGIFDCSNHPIHDEVKPMVDIMVHRGPDADGFVVEGPLAMGMRRLSIIDLVTGDQPVYNETGTISIVFNGEIYNYVELRGQLLQKGHVFKTTSDTEVLIHLYEEVGVELLSQLNGMFAFALWDGARQRLFLARDRMGVKPLYYVRTGSRFSFASELKALLQQPGLDRNLDMDALADYLRLGYVPRQASPIRSVQRLLPGHFLLIDKEQCVIRQWWYLGAISQNSLSFNMDECQTDLVDLFDDAVKLRMRSDVPVASFLSGGLDSSLISVTANQLSPYTLQTYTVGFSETLFDETPYAEAVACQSQTDHHQLIVNSEDAIALLPRLLWYMDEPMADSAILPSYLVSRSAAQNVKVCLSGLGGDELFGGYSRYSVNDPGRIRRIFQPIPKIAGALAPAIERLRPAWGEELRLASDSNLAWRSYLHRLQIFDTTALHEMGFPAQGKTEEIIESLWKQYPGEDSVGRRQFIDQQTYLPDQILSLTDRMSMAVSLEVRVPFLDFRLVQFSANLPAMLKQNEQEFKIYLKSKLGNRVSATILTRPKWGFDSPISRWLVMPYMLPLVRQLPGKLADVINPRYTLKLVKDVDSITRYARRVWSLMVLYVWLQVHSASEPPDVSLQDLFNGA